jgi:hypothetical protein
MFIIYDGNNNIIETRKVKSISKEEIKRMDFSQGLSSITKLFNTM